MRPDLAALPSLVAFLAAASMAAPAAAAECPQEFGAGLIIVSDDGGTARLIRNAEGQLEEVVTFEDGGDFRTTSLNGILVTFYAEIDDSGADIADSVERITFDVPLDQMPTIAPGMNWSSQFYNTYSDGETDAGTAFVSVGPELTRSYVECSYTVLPVTVRERFEADADYLMALDYIPALGLAVLRATGDWGSAPDVALVPTSIRSIE
jgi:hypothetical protein